MNYVVEKLRYGFNPHQSDANLIIKPICIDNKQYYPIELINGNMSAINTIDAIHGWLISSEIMDTFNYDCAVSMKHTTPAGVAVALPNNKLLKKSLDIFSLPNNIKQNDLENQSIAFIKSRMCDPLSSFGDFISISSNKPVGKQLALLIKREVSDGIIASDYTEEALKILKQKKSGKFIIIKANLDYYNEMKKNGWIEKKCLYGITIKQNNNNNNFNLNEIINDESNSKLTETDKKLFLNKNIDLGLSWITMKYSQSNNICMAYDGYVIGIGAGQQNRVQCIKLAGDKSMNFLIRHNDFIINYFNNELINDDKLKRQDRINKIYDKINKLKLDNYNEIINNIKENHKLVMSSDGFLPFSDNVDTANQYGIKFILHPGGSIRDDENFKRADELDIKIGITGYRMFYH